METCVYTPSEFLAALRKIRGSDTGVIRTSSGAAALLSELTLRFSAPVDLICEGPCAAPINIRARLMHEPGFLDRPLGEKIHAALATGEYRNVIVYPTCCENYDAEHQARITAAYPVITFTFFYIDFFYRGFAQAPVANLVRCMLDDHVLEIIPASQEANHSGQQ